MNLPVSYIEQKKYSPTSCHVQPSFLSAKVIKPTAQLSVSYSGESNSRTSLQL